MRWAFQDRWDKIVRLEAIAHGDRNAITARVADAFQEAGAWIVDTHFFSGIMTTFSFEVTPAHVPALQAALVKAGLRLDDASLPVLAAAAHAETEELEGTLALTFAEGTDVRHEVPAVPG